jgi:hypothetical protein
MFYSQFILAKKGPLGKVWLAAHLDKRLTKNQIFQTDIKASVGASRPAPPCPPPPPPRSPPARAPPCAPSTGTRCSPPAVAPAELRIVPADGTAAFVPADGTAAFAQSPSWRQPFRSRFVCPATYFSVFGAPHVPFFPPPSRPGRPSRSPRRVRAG